MKRDNWRRRKQVSFERHNMYGAHSFVSGEFLVIFFGQTVTPMHVNSLNQSMSTFFLRKIYFYIERGIELPAKCFFITK